jgi:hypothetical protein
MYLTGYCSLAVWVLIRLYSLDVSFRRKREGTKQIENQGKDFSVRKEKQTGVKLLSIVYPCN